MKKSNALFAGLSLVSVCSVLMLSSPPAWADRCDGERCFDDEGPDATGATRPDPMDSIYHPPAQSSSAEYGSSDEGSSTYVIIADGLYESEPEWTAAVVLPQFCAPQPKKNKPVLNFDQKHKGVVSLEYFVADPTGQIFSDSKACDHPLRAASINTEKGHHVLVVCKDQQFKFWIFDGPSKSQKTVSTINPAELVSALRVDKSPVIELGQTRAQTTDSGATWTFNDQALSLAQIEVLKKGDSATYTIEKIADRSAVSKKNFSLNGSKAVLNQLIKDCEAIQIRPNQGQF